ncbi:hypothetical protein [Turicimonas muris]|uniref:Uncharacterized protein n=1 Tax=Turicimonas muris TaxID=1796652 RepID=A0A227KT70_9BURK|nr:hypothetical protein [Turicimonas muris]ANU65465.1 hypothetical protein A4V04_02750 [Burkholderiales bacterium YL45]OXE51275.1 hypothetical protein ADH67_02990 [Turicimonas muris]
MNRGFSVTFNKDGLFVQLTSFFSKAGFTRILRLEREPASPQAATMEFSAIFFKLISALRPGLSRNWSTSICEPTMATIQTYIRK